MKKILKKLSVLGITVAMMAGLTGCGEKFDASTYVKSCMDAVYKEDYTEYAKQVDISEEEAKTDMDAEFASAVDAAIAQLNPTDEEKERYSNLLKEVYKTTKYTVGEAKENGDAFEVTVEVEPVDIMEKYADGLADKYNEAINAGTFTEDQTMTIACDFLQECIDNASYGEKTTITVPVELNDKVWEIPEAEMSNIENALLSGLE